MIEHVGCFSFFATHFHELTELTKQYPTCFNLQVSAQTQHNEITFLYQVKPGICDESFGIHVARLTCFPDYVIKLSELKVRELEGFFSDVQLDANDCEMADQYMSDFLGSQSNLQEPPEKLNTLLQKIALIYS